MAVEIPVDYNVQKLLTGKWTTQEEAHQASQNAHLEAGKIPMPSTSSKTPAPVKEESKTKTNVSMISTAKPTARPSTTAGSHTTVAKQKPQVGHGGRAVASSLEVSKRKREGNPGPVSSEEAAALAAREAAKKRILDREKSLLGLYQAY